MQAPDHLFMQPPAQMFCSTNMTLHNATTAATAAPNNHANRPWIQNKQKNCGAGLSRSPSCLHNSTCSL